MRELEEREGPKSISRLEGVRGVCGSPFQTTVQRNQIKSNSKKGKELARQTHCACPSVLIQDSPARNPRALLYMT